MKPTAEQLLEDKLALFVRKERFMKALPNDLTLVQAERVWLLHDGILEGRKPFDELIGRLKK